MNECLRTWHNTGPFPIGKPASASQTYSILEAPYCDIPADGAYALAGSQNDWSVMAFEVFAVSIVDAPVLPVVPDVIGLD